MSDKEPEQCSVDGCDRLAVTRGMCGAHYGRFKRTGRVDADRPIGVRQTPRECAVEGCTNIATERGWCHGHYLRWVRLGDVQPDRPLERRVNGKWVTSPEVVYELSSST